MLIPAMATRESGNDTRRHQQTTARGASSLFLFLWRGQGPQIKLNWSATRVSFPGRIEAIENLEKHTSARRATPCTSWIDMPPPRSTPSPPDTCKRVSTIVATPLARHRPRPSTGQRTGLAKPQSASLSSRFHRRQNRLAITKTRSQTDPPRAPELTKSSRVQQSP